MCCETESHWFMWRKLFSTHPAASASSQSDFNFLSRDDAPPPDRKVKDAFCSSLNLVSPAHKQPRGSALQTQLFCAGSSPPWCGLFEWQLVRRRTPPRPSRCVWGAGLAVWVQRRGWSRAETADLQTPTSAPPSESVAPTSASRSSDAQSPETHRYTTSLQTTLLH